MNEIIAFLYDNDGNEIPISLADIYMNCADMIKLMYFDYMIKCQSYNPMPDLGIFKECHQKIFDNMMNDVHNVYVDHIEGIRKTVGTTIEPNNG